MGSVVAVRVDRRCVGCRFVIKFPPPQICHTNDLISNVYLSLLLSGGIGTRRLIASFTPPSACVPLTSLLAATTTTTSRLHRPSKHHIEQSRCCCGSRHMRQYVVDMMQRNNNTFIRKQTIVIKTRCKCADIKFSIFVLRLQRFCDSSARQRTAYRRFVFIARSTNEANNIIVVKSFIAFVPRL